jgi:hypothetical protein
MLLGMSVVAFSPFAFCPGMTVVGRRGEYSLPGVNGHYIVDLHWSSV